MASLQFGFNNAGLALIVGTTAPTDRSVNTGESAVCLARSVGQIHMRTVPRADQQYKPLFPDNILESRFRGELD